MQVKHPKSTLQDQAAPAVCSLKLCDDWPLSRVEKGSPALIGPAANSDHCYFDLPWEHSWSLPLFGTQLTR